MIGLIRKDLLNIRGTMAYMMVIGVIFAAAFSGASVMTPTVITACLIGTTFTYDRNSGWDSFAVSVGTGRKEIVDSKYILSLMLMMLGLAVGVAVTLVRNAVLGCDMDPGTLADAVMMSVSASMIMISVCCTVNYAVNSDRALAATGLTSSMCVIVAVIISMLISSGDVELTSSVPTIMMMIGTVVLISGYLVSQSIFGRRDL